MCYKFLGQKQKAISIIENQLKAPNYNPGLFDYLHLGVLYWQENDLERAEASLIKQQEINDLAENRYYLGRVYLLQQNITKAKEQLQTAKEKYLKESRMTDPYTVHADKIYMKDIESALKMIQE